MKLLVIRFGAIGDLVLSTPVLRALKRGGHTVHQLLGQEYHEILAHNPNVDKFYHYDMSERLNEKLREEAYDAIIDLQNDTSSNYLVKILGVKAYRAPGHSWISHLFEFRHKPGAPKQHQVDRYFEAVKPLGIENDGEGLDHFIPQAAEVPYSDIPTSHQLGFLALVIGGSAFTKRLPLQKLKQFCVQVNHPIIILGGHDDAARGEELRMLDPGKIYNACGKFSFHESADLLRKSKLVVTNDTGLMHVAAALKKPVITTWGSTVPAQGMTPYYGERHLRREADPSVDIQVERLWCRPCTNTGRSSCPLGHFNCMKKIDVSLLVKESERRLWKRD